MAWLMAAILCTLAATWPLASAPGQLLPEHIHHADVEGALWWNQAVADAVLAGRNPFWQPDLGWPEGQDLRLLVWTFALQLLGLPLMAAASDPAVALGYMVLAVVALNGWTSALAGRLLGGRTGACWGLVLGCCSGYTLAEAGGGKLEQALWGVFALAGALMLRATDQGWTRTRVWLAALLLALGAANYWMYGYFAALVLIPVTAALAARAPTRPTARQLVGVGLRSLLLAAPFALAILPSLGSEANGYVQMLSTQPDLERVQQRATLGLDEGLAGSLSSRATAPGLSLPLLTLPTLMMLLFAGRRQARLMAGLGLAGVVLALGPVIRLDPVGWRLLMPQTALNWALPGMDRFWWPYRWQALTLTALVLGGAWSARNMRAGKAVFLLGAAITAADGWTQLRGGVHGVRHAVVEVRVPSVLHRISELPGVHPVFVLPVDAVGNGGLGWQAYHRQPISGGMAWMWPQIRGPIHASRLENVPLLQALQTQLHSGQVQPPEEGWTEQSAGGIHLVMLNRPALGSGAQDALLRLARLLGRPVHDGEMLAVWTVPGAGPPRASMEAEHPHED